MPTRDPPHRVFTAHEVHPDVDVDWTKPADRSDWNLEWRLRDARNDMIRDQLQRGQTVQYRSGGWSLYPRAWSGDRCMYEPVRIDTMIHTGDVVFCRVKPKNLYYAHLLIRIDNTAGSARSIYWSGNMGGHINGWCYKENIYGRLIEAVY